MDAGQSNKGRFKAAVLIVSDRAYSGVRPDATGPRLNKFLVDSGYPVVSVDVVADDKSAIIEILRKWIHDGGINLILVAGGTGLAPRDVTPEATMEVIERRIPGMEEAMRQASFITHPHAILSRAVVGCTGVSLIVDLPGNPQGALDNLKIIAPALLHALELITGGTPDR